MGLYWALGKTTELGAEGDLVYGTVQDATGLPIGTPVHLAGIEVGVIESLSLAGTNAELAIRLKQDITLFEDAILLKRTPSILSEPVLEISAGTKDTGQLKDGGHIKRTTESPHLDDTIRALSNAIPEFGENALSFKTTVDEADDAINFEVAPKVDEWKNTVENFSTSAAEKLANADSTMEDIENSVEFDAKKEIGDRLDNAVKTTKSWPSAVSQYTPQVKDLGKSTRETIVSVADDAQEAWKEYATDAKHVDEGIGRLGKLVNNRDLANTLESGVEGAVNAVKTITGWTMGLTMRAEMQAASGLPQFYFTLKAQRKPENFYILEIVKNTRGRVFQNLRYDPSIGRFRQFATIEEQVSFTMQWGKRFRNFAFRGGIKESTLGAGMDVYFFNDNFRLSSDLYDFGFFDNPRLRVSANMKVYGSFFATAGIADALNPGTTLPIEPRGVDVPIQFEEYRFGRDFFLGGELRFDERDIAGLLFIAQDAVSSLGGRSTN